MVHRRRTLVHFEVDGQSKVLPPAEALQLAEQLIVQARKMTAEALSFGSGYLHREDIMDALVEHAPGDTVKHRVALLYKGLHAYSLKIPSMETLCTICGRNVRERCSGSIMNHAPGAHSFIVFNTDSVRSVNQEYFRDLPFIGQRVINDLNTLIATLPN